MGLINKSVGLNEAGGAGGAGLQALRSAATWMAGAFSTLLQKIYYCCQLGTQNLQC